MRCCSRSTTSRGRLLRGIALGLLLAPAAWAGGTSEAGTPESAVRHAVVQAVKARMGRDADVRIEDLSFKTTTAPAGAVLAASPEPGARLGRQNRFSLRWVAPGSAKRPSVSGGYAVAKVFVTVEHVRASRDLARGETCAEGDVTTSRGEVGAVPLHRLPALDAVVGTRVLRPIAADEVVTNIAVLARPTVQSGDVVTVRAAVGGVSVQGKGVAEQSGNEGDVIRVVNRESRKALKARVIGPGTVEVLQ